MLLLDTNIASYFFKQHRIWSLYFSLTVGRELAVSFQTIAEMEEGSLLDKWSLPAEKTTFGSVSSAVLYLSVYARRVLLVGLCKSTSPNSTHQHCRRLDRCYRTLV